MTRIRALLIMSIVPAFASIARPAHAELASASEPAPNVVVEEESTAPPTAQSVDPQTSLAMPPRADVHTVWYGWQTMIADAGSAGIMATAIGLTPAAGSANVAAGFFFGGLGTFALAAPAVHLANHEPGRAAGSLGMRVGLTTLGFAIGVASAESDCAGRSMCFKSLGVGAVGALLGMVTASVLDASVLAYKREPKRVASFGLAPQIDPSRQAYGLGFIATGW